jgi:hypothetical protein
MPLLLTILSVAALWSFLTLLVFGLLLIRKGLESVRGHLERITMGVRAIDRQTAPLHLEVPAFVRRLTDTVAATEALTLRLTDAERALGTARRGDA